MNDCGGVTTGTPHEPGTCYGCDVWNWGAPTDLLHYRGVTHPDYPLVETLTRPRMSWWTGLKEFFGG